MKKDYKEIFCNSRLLLFALVMLLIVQVFVFSSCDDGKSVNEDGSTTEVEQSFDSEDEENSEDADIEEDGEYTTAEEVAAYIHKYHKLPQNYVTEEEALELGWKTNEDPSEYGIMIGGKVFKNKEKQLPNGHSYTECDVDYDGNMRGENRLVFTEKGTVYHTTDHYKNFERLYLED